MLVLRCTTKAFKKLSHKPQAIEVSHADANLGEWYVNTVDYLNDGDLVRKTPRVAGWQREALSS